MPGVECRDADAADELWQFSLAFYGRPGVAPALIALQDRAGCDVNLVLAALWLGLSGRPRLTPDGLAAAAAAVAPLRERVVGPLRRLRRALKTDPAADIQALRAKIEAIEIEAERAAQRRLAASPAAGEPPVDELPLDARLAASAANLALALGPAAERAPEAALLLASLAAFAAGSAAPRL